MPDANAKHFEEFVRCGCRSILKYPCLPAWKSIVITQITTKMRTSRKIFSTW